MKLLGFLLCATMACVLSAFGQQPLSTIADVGQLASLPRIIVNNHAPDLQAGIYPNNYRTNSVLDDMAWVARSDSSVLAFIQQNGDSVLQSLSRLSGFAWDSRPIELFLVRYFPTPGSSNPAILPIGGIRIGALTEAIPAGSVTQLNCIFQLARRLLAQSQSSDSPQYARATQHPLMQPGAFRRDNLAFLLALAVSKQIIGDDSTRAAYQSLFWKRFLVGREVFEQYLYNTWNLAAERPLITWIADEPTDSKLVDVTETQTDLVEQTGSVRRPRIEGVSPTGLLGFSIKGRSASQLIVDKIDSTRAAYKCGLRAGDVIVSVDSERPKNHKDMVELILDHMDAGGAMVHVTRNGKAETVFLRKGAVAKP